MVHEWLSTGPEERILVIQNQMNLTVVHQDKGKLQLLLKLSQVL